MPKIIVMERAEFNQKLSDSIQKKAQWFDTTSLPKALEDLKLLHTCVRNIYDVLLKRSLVVPDPYREDVNITKIVSPSNEAFPDTEASVVIGSRYSQYEAMLEFIATRFRFSCDNFTLQKIKRLNELLSSFLWGNLSTMSAEPNTRGLANLIHDSRKNLDALSSSLLNDSLSKAASSTQSVLSTLKELTSFKREEYKCIIRTKVFDEVTASLDGVTSPEEEISAIKKAIAAMPKKMNVYNELIGEIANEDFAGNKDSLRDTVLRRLSFKEVKKKTTPKVDTHAMLIDAVRALTVMAPMLGDIAEKITNNRDILEASHKTLFDKIKAALRRSFNMKERPLIYRLTIEDKDKGARRNRDVDINIFIGNIQKKSALLNALSNPGSPESHKIEKAPDDTLLEFLNKQITENREILTLLIASDEYFKSNVTSASRGKIKGLKIDLVTVNNAIVKANKRRADYLDAAEGAMIKEKLGLKSA